MKRAFLLGLIVIAVIALAMLAGTALAQRGSQRTICHRPPGNPSNAQTITVSESAVPAHQRHGDTMGPCPGTPF
jgi:hypothetical protein